MFIEYDFLISPDKIEHRKVNCDRCSVGRRGVSYWVDGKWRFHITFDVCDNVRIQDAKD